MKTTKNNWIWFKNYLEGLKISNFIYYKLWFIVNNNNVNIIILTYMCYILKTSESTLFKPIIVYLNNNYFVPLFKNKSFLSWISKIMNGIVFIIISVLIINNVDLNIKTELSSEIATFISVKLGLLERNMWGGWYVGGNYKFIFLIKTYVVFGILQSIINIILFITLNYKYIIFNILGIIFMKSFLLNFYQKHYITNILNFMVSAKSNYSLKDKIKGILNVIVNNLEKIFYSLIKFMWISILIVMTLRYIIYLLLPFSSDNYISNGLILILPLPIIYYFINIGLKIIKKQTIKSDDYYLFNNFVINNTNLYRIVFILSINYIARNYYLIYMVSIIIISLIIISILAFIYHDINIKLPKGGIILRSGNGVFLSTVSGFISLTPFLQQACNEGYINHIAPLDDRHKHTSWTNIPFKNPGIYHMDEKTVNFTLKKERLWDNTITSDKISLFDKHRSMLNNSPILNMTYNLYHTEVTQGVYQYHIIDESSKEVNLNKKEVRVLNFFSNNNYYGSVTEVIKEKFLIVILIRKDLNGSIFMPTYYLPDNTDKGQMSVMDISRILQLKYRIILPVEANTKGGFMIFTQAESISPNSSLFRVWRPSIKYFEPELIKDNVRVRDYFKLNSSYSNKLEEFTYKEEETKIKSYAKRNAEDIPTINRDNTNIKKLEKEANKYCLNMYQKFLLKGLVDNTFIYKNITGNDSSINSLIQKSDNSLCTFVSMAPEGVIDGLKESDGLLGKMNTEFYLPLYNFRVDMLSSMAHWWDNIIDSSLKSELKSIYAISINRLTFEFLEVRPCSNIYFGYKQLSHKDDLNPPFLISKKMGFEIFSIIDTNNDNSKFPLVMNSNKFANTIPKHDYHFFDNKDEHSIRKFMDHVYDNKEYLSDKLNIVNSQINAKQSSDNNQEMIRRISYQMHFFKPDRMSNLGIPKRDIISEWEDQNIVNPMNYKNKKFLREMNINKHQYIKELRHVMKELDSSWLDDLHEIPNEAADIVNNTEDVIMEDAPPSFEDELLSLYTTTVDVNTEEDDLYTND